MFTLLCIHHIRRDSLDVCEGAVLRPNQVTVAHQRAVIAIDADDAMHDIPMAIHPCQHHVANFQLLSLDRRLL